VSFRDLQDLANDQLFSTTHFGETVTYTPAGVGQAPVAVVGIPRQDPVLTDGDIPISSTVQRIDLRAADISAGGPKKGAFVLWRGVTYLIESVDGPDDAGVCSCTLLRTTNP